MGLLIIIFGFSINSIFFMLEISFQSLLKFYHNAYQKSISETDIFALNVSVGEICGPEYYKKVNFLQIFLIFFKKTLAK